MKIKTITYTEYKKQIPQSGRHILASQTVDTILVYQAFKPAIADYAIRHQQFGGSDYSYTRMSWIKPNFLWMMYRAGWATKRDQERILGIYLKKDDFNYLLSHSAFTSYDATQHESHESWKNELAHKEVRLQWDPDHDPYGNKEVRKAMQIGIKGELLQKFGKSMITEIVDLTDFVESQRALVDSKNLDQLVVPEESVYMPDSADLRKQIGLEPG